MEKKTRKTQKTGKNVKKTQKSENKPKKRRKRKAEPKRNPSGTQAEPQAEPKRNPSGTQAEAKREPSGRHENMENREKTWKSSIPLRSRSAPAPFLLRFRSVPASNTRSLNATMIMSMSGHHRLLPQKNHQKMHTVYKVKLRTMKFTNFMHHKIHQETLGVLTLP